MPSDRSPRAGWPAAACVTGLLLCGLAFGPHGAVAAASPQAAAAAQGASAAATPAPSAPDARPIDINSASKAQLKTLPGIGDAEAERIVAGRPYLSKAELVNRSVLPTAAYLSIKRQIIAVQQPGTRPKAPKKPAHA